jgi:hypothetical protein
MKWLKRAGTTPAPMDVDIDGVVCLVKMADSVYPVSANYHSDDKSARVGGKQ